MPPSVSSSSLSFLPFHIKYATTPTMAKTTTPTMAIIPPMPIPPLLSPFGGCWYFCWWCVLGQSLCISILVPSSNSMLNISLHKSPCAFLSWSQKSFLNIPIALLLQLLQVSASFNFLQCLQYHLKSVIVLFFGLPLLFSLPALGVVSSRNGCL
jgi:hypothetical protein